MTLASCLFVAIDVGRIEVPESARPWLHWGGLALAAFCALYLLLSILRALHRRAYNLTKAETAPVGKAGKPSFLTVDHEARAEAIQRGDEYVRPADREAVAATKARKLSVWQSICRVAAVLAGVAQVAIFVGTVLAKSEQADRGWHDASAMERLQTLASRYWIGLVLAALVIAATVIHTIASRKKSD